VSLSDTMKLLQFQVDNLGEETLEQERLASTMTSIRVRDLQRELERFKSLEKVKSAEIERHKETIDKQKKKFKEIESENEELHEKIHTLKQEKAELERQLLFQGSSSNDVNMDFEKTKLRQKIEELERKIEKKR
jgi:predicted RNase H-like nuclease (RuvC/YqgF family)